jgi:putative tricarboxylic transport membrane protein
MTDPYAGAGRTRQPGRRGSVALGLAASIAAGALASLPAGAQAPYPQRPVMLIVPYGAGGIADTGMRIVADKLSAKLGQQVLVDNRPGAGGIVAAKAGSSAVPDGHTLLMTGNNNALSEVLFKSLPYNILTDFASTSTTSFFDLLIVTRGDSPLKTLQDVVKAAQASPGKLNIGTINPGSTQNLAAELFRSSAGINVTIVPFRTSPDMTSAILRGDVDLAFEFYAAIQGQVVDHKMHVLASTGPKRTAYLPDVPTVQEGGIKGYEVVSWNGISAPAATPAPIIEAISRAINEVLPLPDVQEKSQRLGMDMRASTPDEMTARMKSDIAKWGAVIEKAGIPKRD